MLETETDCSLYLDMRDNHLSLKLWSRKGNLIQIFTKQNFVKQNKGWTQMKNLIQYGLM